MELVQNYDRLSIVTPFLARPDWKNYDGVPRMLDVLLSHETSEAEKRGILRDDFDIQMTRTPESKVSVMCNRHKPNAGNQLWFPTFFANQ